MPPPRPESGVPRQNRGSSLHDLLRTAEASFLPIPAILFLVTVVVLYCIRWVVLQLLARKRRKSRTMTASMAASPAEKPAKLEKNPTPPSPTVIFKPIYPWTAPPQPLPGPYDPRLFPQPTIRRHSSYDPAIAAAATESTTNTITYTRRVSTNSIPPRTAMLHGTVTTASTGWRRNAWTVGAG